MVKIKLIILGYELARIELETPVSEPVDLVSKAAKGVSRFWVKKMTS